MLVKYSRDFALHSPRVARAPDADAIRANFGSRLATYMPDRAGKKSTKAIGLSPTARGKVSFPTARVKH